MTLALRRSLRVGAVVLGLAAAVAAAGHATSTTRQGLDFHVSTRQVPLLVKAVDFLHRHWQYQLLAQDITRGCRTQEEIALATFYWTREHIRPTPPGWPIVDDHILHIIIRGYGVSDQMADVFTTLATYAGVEAFWKSLIPEGEAHGVVLSFAKVNGRWTVCDVAHGILFRDARGGFADVETLARQPELMASSLGEHAADRRLYEDGLAHMVPVRAPVPLRAQEQMPWPRCWFASTRWLRSHVPAPFRSRLKAQSHDLQLPVEPATARGVRPVRATEGGSA